MNNRLITSLFAFMMPIFLMGQSVIGNVSGEGQPLVGANVVIEGTELGGVTDENGNFLIDVPAGDLDITASFIGYKPQTLSVKVEEEVASVNFVLELDALILTDIEVLASRADKSTPVAYTNVSKEEMEIRLGSQDIPMILNTTPSVYATQQGGGAGDARILSLIHI